MHGIRDRRTSLRVEIEGEAVVYTERDVIEGRCLDLGREGLAVRSTRATRSKAPVTLELYIQGQRMRVEAVLVRRKRFHGDYIMGFRFVEVDLETSARIDRLIFGRLAASPHAELLLAFAAHHAATYGLPTAPAPTVDRTVVAEAGVAVPVITGYTQVIAIDQPPLVDRTVIAPPPTRTDTVRFGAEPGEPLPPTAGSISPDDAWFEDEMDTAEIRLLEAAVEPGLALSSEPIRIEPADSTVVVTAPSEPIHVAATVGTPPDSTVVVTAPSEPIHVAAAVGTPPDSTVVVTAPSEPTEPTNVAAVAVEPPERTEALTTASTPPDPTVVVTAPSEPTEPTVVVTATEPASRLEPTSITGVPEAVARTRSSTMALTIDGEPIDGEPPEGPRTATIPLLAPALPTRSPHAEPAGHTVPITEATVPSSAPLRPTQRALQDAMALLRAPDPGTRRGPRVIVSIPHQTYPRRSPPPWNR